MATEIERKFLVRGEEWRRGTSKRVRQGYLSRDRERTVRVRIAGRRASLTIKGAGKGIARSEFEYHIPLRDAEALLALCDRPPLEKNRYTLRQAGVIWEVDEFLGANAGLVVAEIELEHEQQSFRKPAWLSTEVTEDPRYLNSNLVDVPYSTWGRAGG